MCSDFQFSLCVDTFSLNLDSDCELFSFVFVYNRHFLVLFWAVNCMVCALTSSTIKAFRFMCLCLSMTFRSGPHSSFLTFNFVCESYTFFNFTVVWIFLFVHRCFLSFEICALHQFMDAINISKKSWDDFSASRLFWERNYYFCIQAQKERQGKMITCN